MIDLELILENKDMKFKNIIRLVLYHTPDRDDILQDFYITVITQRLVIEKYLQSNCIDAGYNYLRKILRTKFKNYKPKEIQYEDYMDNPIYPNTNNIDLNNILIEIESKLKRDEWWLYSLKVLEGYTYRELEQDTKIPRSTLYDTMNRANKKIEKIIEKYKNK